MKNSIIALVFFATCLTSHLNAALVQWTGDISTDWNNSANWDCDCLPMSDDDVRIGLNEVVDIMENISIRVQSLQVRGNLTIGEGSTLEVNGQNTLAVGGLQMIIGTLVNEGEIIVQQTTGGYTAFYIGTNASVQNSGSILVRDVLCEESSCSSTDAVEIDGELNNYGIFALRNTQGKDGVTVRKSLYNEGVFIVDSIQNNSLNTFSLSQGSSFENTLDASFELSNVTGLDGISRGFSNVQDSVTIVNAGEMQLTGLNENIFGLDVRGDGTRLENTGEISIEGGKIAAIIQQGTVLQNEGSFQFTGQTQYGMRISSIENSSNTGTISMINGSVNTGILINTGETTSGLVNAGTIIMSSYLTPGSLNTGINLVSGILVNEGEIVIIGGGEGRGIQTRENTLSTSTGAITLDSLNYGLWLGDDFTNEGALDFGSMITQRPISNALVENSGTITGFGTFEAGDLSFLDGSILAPGVATQTTTFVFANNLLLPNETAIILDIAANNSNPDLYDQIRAEDELSFSGEMTVNLLESFDLSSGSFTLLEGGSMLAGNPVINLPDPPAGSDWRIEQTANAIILHLDIINAVDDLLQVDHESYLYPNPVKPAGLVYWSGVDAFSETIEFTLFSNSGKLVRTWEGWGNETTLSLPSVPEGVYVLHWKSKQRTGSQQLIIQN